MVKITDVLGAMVAAQAQAAEWEAEFQAAFFGPLRLAEQVQQFLAQSPEQRAGLAPEEQAAMTAHARRMQASMNAEGRTQKAEGG